MSGHSRRTSWRLAPLVCSRLTESKTWKAGGHRRRMADSMRRLVVSEHLDQRMPRRRTVREGRSREACAEGYASAVRRGRCRSTRTEEVRGAFGPMESCRTYNPHSFRTVAKAPREPMFTRAKRMLTILGWRHSSTAFRGPCCRQVSATPAAVSQGGSLLTRAGVHGQRASVNAEEQHTCTGLRTISGNSF